MKQPKEKISITLDAELLKYLKEISEKEERPLSQYINLLLKKASGYSSVEKESDIK